MTLKENQSSDFPVVPERSYFPIGEAAQLAGRSPHILRYWEREVPALAKVKRRNGRRYYTRDEVLLLQRIGGMLAEGATLEGVCRRLREGGKKTPPLSWLREELQKVLSVL